MTEKDQKGLKADDLLENDCCNRCGAYWPCEHGANTKSSAHHTMMIEDHSLKEALALQGYLASPTRSASPSCYECDRVLEPPSPGEAISQLSICRRCSNLICNQAIFGNECRLHHDKYSCPKLPRPLDRLVDYKEKFAETAEKLSRANPFPRSPTIAEFLKQRRLL